MKIFFKSAYYAGITLCFILLIEAGFFYKILISKQPTSPADAIVVFHGSSIRDREGYRLANEGYAPLLTISSAGSLARKEYDTMYHRTGTWKHLPEEKAETTFQNALLTSRLIRENHLKKIILVTDAWHIPRSYLLLKMMLIGTDVDILPFGTGNESYAGSPMKWKSRQKKRIYNELVEFWGSMTELAHYGISHRLPEKGLKERAWVKALRKALLEDVS